jgi:glycosyltransferase involved in cell wall biosynthesis
MCAERTDHHTVVDHPLASVVVATYRRPRVLRDTLCGLQAQQMDPPDTFEVVVIDNDPAQSAGAVVAELKAGWPQTVRLHYVPESRLGLSYARNRGIDEARGDVIAFLDDDVFVSPTWLRAMLQCFKRTESVCVGGRTLIQWEGDPELVVQACADRLLGFDLGEIDLPIRGRQTPGGGNSAFRRKVFENGMRFSTDLGRVGKILLSGEDTELMARLKQAGQPIWYCAAALVHHRTGGQPLTRKRVVRQRYWFGISHAIVDQRLYGKRYQLTRAAARAAKALLVDVPRWCFGVVACSPGRRLIAGCSLAKQTGYVAASLSLVSALNRVAAERQSDPGARVVDGLGNQGNRVMAP